MQNSVYLQLISFLNWMLLKLHLTVKIVTKKWIIAEPTLNINKNKNNIIGVVESYNFVNVTAKAYL